MENVLVDIIIQAVLFLYPAWRIATKAGLSPGIGLSVLIPNIGLIIFALILIFSKWNIQSVQTGDM